MSTTSSKVLGTDIELPAPEKELGRVQSEMGEIYKEIARGKASAVKITIASAIAAIVGAVLATGELRKDSEELSDVGTIEILITALGIGGALYGGIKAINPGDPYDGRRLQLLLHEEELLIRQSMRGTKRGQ